MSFRSAFWVSFLFLIPTSSTFSAPPTATLSMQSRSVAESSGVVEVMAKLDQPASYEMIIPFNIGGGARQGTDYTLSATSFVIPAGSQSSTVAISIIDNNAQTYNRNVNISLQGSSSWRLGFPSSFNLNIIEDDERDGSRKPLASFASSMFTLNEGGKVAVTVILDKPVAQNQNVWINLNNSGSANGGDFRLSSYSIQIPSGQTRGSVELSIQDDTQQEGEETLVLSLNTPNQVAPGAVDVLYVTIPANDLPPEDVPLQVTCGSYSTPISWKYCINKTVGSQSKDIMFYFHGATDSQDTWTKGPGVERRRDLRLYWRDSRQDAPTVVAISLGNLWMLTEEPTGGNPATFPIVADQIIPFVENNLLGGLQPGGRRILMGISMGGFNSIQLLLKRPQLWYRAHLTAPMMPICDPHMPDNALKLCIAMDPYARNYLFGSMGSHMLASNSFPRPDQWDRVDPIKLGQRRLGPHIPPFMITCGTADEFGFYTKNKRFAGIAQDLGANVTWLPTDREHGYFEPAAAGDFLLGR